MADKDEYLLVLDFREHGGRSGKDEPVAQGIGKDNYNLLEVVMRDDERPKGGEELYIGEGERDRVKYIKSKIGYGDLTGNSRNELQYVMREIINEKEDEFVEFFNEATPVTPRRHAFELLPGIGSKHMQKLLDEREAEEFEDLDDVKERVPSMPDPRDAIIERITSELKDDTKRNLFVKG